MIKILVKDGFELNPNEKVVKSILRMCENNNGDCPCKNDGYDKKCPCSDYRENDNCHCGLYKRVLV